MVYSHSRLGTYETCPRQFAFQYIEKPEVDKRDSIEAFMGSRVHETLQMVYEQVGMEKTPSWEEVERFYNDDWDKNFYDRIRIVNQDYTAQDYKNVGRRCIREYFFRYFPFRHGRVVGLEERLVFDLDGDGKYKIQGYIDRLVDNGGGVWSIHDYKTNRRVPSQEEVERYRQLALYQIGVQKRWPEAKQVNLVWHFLRANREARVMPSTERVEEVRSEVMHLIDEIEDHTARSDFSPHESQLCAWCDYQSVCPAKRHLFATAKLTPEEYAADAGVQLADAFAVAKAQEAEAKNTVSTIREEIIQYAESQDLTVLNGHEIRVKVSKKQEMKVPTKTESPDAREQIEEVILESGQWEAVSELSNSKLIKALRKGQFEAATQDKLNRLLEVKETKMVRTSFPKQRRDDPPADYLN